jgi:FtsP/CotA-like multicopper oxidase with cupredoxin domain
VSDASDARLTPFFQLQLEAGQRYSVLVDMDQAPGTYAMHGDMTDSMFGYKRPGLVQQQSLAMEYVSNATVDGAAVLVGNSATVQAAPLQLDDLKPDTLVPVHRLDPPAATKQETLLVSFGLDATVSCPHFAGPFRHLAHHPIASSQSHYYGFMNGTAWEMPNGTDALVLVTEAARTGGTYRALDNSQLILTNDEIVTMDLIINNEGESEYHRVLCPVRRWGGRGGGGVCGVCGDCDGCGMCGDCDDI